VLLLALLPVLRLLLFHSQLLLTSLALPTLSRCCCCRCCHNWLLACCCWG